MNLIKDVKNLHKLSKGEHSAKEVVGLTLDGQQFMCRKHGLDYRVTCDECVMKYAKFRNVTRKIILK